MGQIPWSPTYQDAKDKLTFWCHLIKRRKGQRISGRYLRRLAKRAGLLGLMTASLDEVIKACTTAWQHYYQVARQAPNHRQSFLEALAVSQSKQMVKQHKNVTPATILKQLILRERQCSTARYLRRVHGR